MLWKANYQLSRRSFVNCLSLSSNSCLFARDAVNLRRPYLRYGVINSNIYDLFNAPNCLVVGSFPIRKENDIQSYLIEIVKRLGKCTTLLLLLVSYFILAKGFKRYLNWKRSFVHRSGMWWVLTFYKKKIRFTLRGECELCDGRLNPKSNRISHRTRTSLPINSEKGRFTWPFTNPSPFPNATFQLAAAPIEFKVSDRNKKQINRANQQNHITKSSFDGAVAFPFNSIFHNHLSP